MGQPDGQVVFLFILAMAAAEVSVGAAPVLELYHQYKSLDNLDAISRTERLTLLDLLWLVAVVPFAGAVALAVLGARRPTRPYRWPPGDHRCIGTRLPSPIAAEFLSTPPPAIGMYAQPLWNRPRGSVPSGRKIALYLDALSLVMMLVVTFVSLLIHLYPDGIHANRRGLQPLLRLHEPVRGLHGDVAAGRQPAAAVPRTGGATDSRYLLIGFWYQDPVNGRGAKSLIVTRVGDTAMTIGLFSVVT